MKFTIICWCVSTTLGAFIALTLPPMGTATALLMGVIFGLAGIAVGQEIDWRYRDKRR